MERKTEAGFQAVKKFIVRMVQGAIIGAGAILRAFPGACLRLRSASISR